MDEYTTKVCTKCGTEKPLEQFHRDKRRRDGRVAQCKECVCARVREYNASPERKQAYREYTQQPEVRQRRRERKQSAAYKAYQSEYDARPDVKAKKLEHSRRPEVKARRAEYQREYLSRPEVIELRNAWARERRKNNPKYRLDSAISGGVAGSLRNGKAGRSWESLVGYTLEELMTHLESQFTEGMTWDNYGRGGWHVDHIVPKSWFQYESPDELGFMSAWALDNLQPLWEVDNFRKNNRWAG